MFTTAKSLSQPGHGPFHLPLCWWTCTFTAELWFLYDGNENLVPSFMMRGAQWDACMVGSEL